MVRLALSSALLALLGAPAWAQDVQFKPRAVYEAASSSPQKMRVADFDGDPGLDILVAAAGTDSGPGEVTILRNRGDGTLNDDGFGTDYHPWAAAAGDFDGDGCVDLAIGDSGHSASDVHVYLNDCSAGMSEGGVFIAGDFPVDAIAALLDADQHLDLAIANNVSGGVKVFRGDGHGAFSLIQGYSASSCTSLDSADFDGDVRPDLLLGTYFGSTVLLNNGDGTFRAGPGVAPGHAADVATGDFNHDGHADAASITHYTGVLTVALGRGDGTFEAGPAFATGGGFVEGLAGADLNKDGFDDLLYTDADGAYVRIYVNDRHGSFGPPVTLATDWQPQDLVVADLDGDGWPDVAAGCRNLGDAALVDVFLQIPPAPCEADFNGDGVVNTIDVLAFLNAWTVHDARADFNGDGTIDTRDVLGFLNAWTVGC